jgi:TPR repeat protein
MKTGNEPLADEPAPDTCRPASSNAVETGGALFRARDYTGCVRMLKPLRPIENRDAPACLYIGCALFAMAVLPTDDDAAATYFMAAAKQFNGIAAYNLGCLWRERRQRDLPIPTFNPIGEYWFREAAHQGEPCGMRALAVSLSGKHSPAAHLEVELWDDEWRDHDLPIDCAGLDLLDPHRAPLPRDPTYALAYFTRKAERGDARALFRCGLLFDNLNAARLSHSVPIPVLADDPDRAATFYRRAVKAGSREAARALKELKEERGNSVSPGD